MTRPFRFGVSLAFADDRAAWIDRLRAAADLGYSTVFMPDHFSDQLAPVAALAVAAEVTDLRIGTYVMANDFRHPAVLAREAATLDLLSEGRLELGIGAGWRQSDYDQAGLAYDVPGRRIERLGEAVAVVKGLLGGGPFSFDGRHYQIEQMTCGPRPVQRPHPPLLLGGGGRRMLELAGREADIVGLNVSQGAAEPERYDSIGHDASAAAVGQRLDWIRAGAGDRFDAIELNVFLFQVQIVPDAAKAAEAVARRSNSTLASVLASPHALIGTTDEVCETLLARRQQYGISYIVVWQSELETMGPVISRLSGR